MIAQIALTNNKHEKPLESFFKQLNISYEFSSNFTNYKTHSLERKPDLFFIQADNSSSSEILDLVSDIRSLFGAIATIIILGEEMSHEKMTAFLAEGADQFFSFPLDLTLIEDFLSKRTKTTYYNAFKYRNIPSRSTEIDIKFDVDLRSVSETSITIASPHLVKNGTLLSFNLKQISTNLPYDVQALTTHCAQLASEEFEIHAVFFEIEDKVKNALTHELRKN
jgi:hypothetical protein